MAIFDNLGKITRKQLQQTLQNTIATTSATTLPNSTAGGLKINHIIGATVQDGEPTPDALIAIQNAGDCVELILGGYSYENGAYSSTSTICCSKNSIPCKSGDSIVLKTEEATTMYVLYYNNGTYVSYANISSVTELTATVPSGVDSFHIRIDTPIETVGKISLTINDKYVVQVKTVGKNLVKPIGTSETKAGITFTDNQDGSFTIKGTSTGNTSFNITNGTIIFNKGVSYTLSKNTISGSGGTITTSVYNSDGSTVYDFIKDGETKTVNEEYRMRSMSVYISSGTTVDCTFTVQLEQGEVATEYTPYTESIAIILLSEPLRQDDVLYKEGGVWYVERNRVTEIYDGDESFSLSSSLTNENRVAISIKAPSSKLVYGGANALSSHLTKATTRELIDDTTKTGFCVGDTSFNSSSAFLVFALPYSIAQDLDTAKAWLVSNPITVEHELATPTIEELDTDSQIALNSLETFDTVTYINIDSRIQPSEIESEYGTSKVGSLMLGAGNIARKALIIAKNAIGKDKIVNNLSTTESGFVLDARQGKELKDLLTGAIKVSSISQSENNNGTIGNVSIRYLRPTPSDGYTIVGVVGANVDENSGKTICQAFWDGERISIGTIQTREPYTSTAPTFTYTIYYLEVKTEFIN